MNSFRGCCLRPRPTRDFGHVDAIAGDILLVLHELVADRLLSVSGPRTELRNTVDDIADEVEAIQIIHHAHVERCAGGTLLLVAAHVKIPVTIAPVGEAVNEPRIAVKGKDDRLVRGEERIEVVIREPMRVLTRW